MPQLVTIDQKKAAVEAVLKEALPRLKVDLPPAMKEKAAKFAAGAFDCLCANADLLEAAAADPQRLRAAVIEAARMGLWIGNTMSADAHLVAFRDKGVAKLQLLTNYRGLEKVAYNTGMIAAINTGTVREGDHFEWEEGSNPFVRHRKSAGERGPVIYSWAVVRLKGSEVPILKVLTRQEIDAVMAASPTKVKQVWNSWFDEQSEKTALKRCLKKCPRSEELARVLDLDDHAMAGKEQRFQAEVTAVATHAPTNGQEKAASAPQSDPEPEEGPPAEVTGEAPKAAPVDPETEGKKLRQKCGMLLSDMGMKVLEKRHRYLGTMGFPEGLSSMPLDELRKLQTFLGTAEGKAEVADFVKGGE